MALLFQNAHVFYDYSYYYRSLAVGLMCPPDAMSFTHSSLLPMSSIDQAIS